MDRQQLQRHDDSACGRSTVFGFALSLAQAGDKHDAAKVLKGFGSAGVLEVVEDDAGGTYRAVYTVKFAEAVFVLHCFQKKASTALLCQKRTWRSSGEG